MSWSTRELAELAGTTLKTVRHYHQVGLLEEPDRAANGYKRYRVEHLIRLLRIRRLTDLGVALSDIPAIESSDETAEETLRSLDSELKTSIERQQQMRDEIKLILEHRSRPDLPRGYDGNVSGMTERDRAWMMLYSQVFDDDAQALLRESSEDEKSEAQREFEALPADADEETRQRLAEAYAPLVRSQFEAVPALEELATSDVPANAVILHAVVELYNPAQLDVLQRLNALLQISPRDRPDTGNAPGS